MPRRRQNLRPPPLDQSHLEPEALAAGYVPVTCPYGHARFGKAERLDGDVVVVRLYGFTGPAMIRHISDFADDDQRRMMERLQQDA